MPVLTESQITDYHRDGYVLVREMLDAEETDLLGRSARQDRELDRRSQGRKDGEGGSVRMSLWNQPGNGIYGMVATVSASSIPWNVFSTARSTTTTRR